MSKMSSSMSKPNFLRVEVLQYRNRGESEETCWKLHLLTTSAVEARRTIVQSDYFMRVVECTGRGRLIVDSNNPADWN